MIIALVFGMTGFFSANTVGTSLHHASLSVNAPQIKLEPVPSHPELTQIILDEGRKRTVWLTLGGINRESVFKPEWRQGFLFVMQDTSLGGIQLWVYDKGKTGHPITPGDLAPVQRYGVSPSGQQVVVMNPQVHLFKGPPYRKIFSLSLNTNPSEGDIWVEPTSWTQDGKFLWLFRIYEDSAVSNLIKVNTSNGALENFSHWNFPNTTDDPMLDTPILEDAAFEPNRGSLVWSTYLVNIDGPTEESGDLWIDHLPSRQRVRLRTGIKVPTTPKWLNATTLEYSDGPVRKQIKIPFPKKP